MHKHTHTPGSFRSNEEQILKVVYSTRAVMPETTESFVVAPIESVH